MNSPGIRPTRGRHRKRLSALRLSSDSTVTTLPPYTSPPWNGHASLDMSDSDRPPDYPDSAEEADEDTDSDDGRARRRRRDHNHDPDHNHDHNHGGHDGAVRDPQSTGGVVHELEDSDEEANAYERAPRRKPKKGQGAGADGA